MELGRTVIECSSCGNSSLPQSSREAVLHACTNSLPLCSCSHDRRQDTSVTLNLNPDFPQMNIVARIAGACVRVCAYVFIVRVRIGTVSDAPITTK